MTSGRYQALLAGRWPVKSRRRSISVSQEFRDFVDLDWFCSEHGIGPREAEYHYARHSSPPGLAPREDFDPLAYWSLHPDVAHARVRPVSHYMAWGRDEGRVAVPVGRASLLRRVIEGQMRSLAALQGTAGGAGTAWALDWLERALRQVIDPMYVQKTSARADLLDAYALERFVALPQCWSSSPSWWFDVGKYLDLYPWVATLPVSPVVHSLANGEMAGFTSRTSQRDRGRIVLSLDTSWHPRVLDGSPLERVFENRTTVEPSDHHLDHDTPGGYSRAIVSIANDDAVMRIGGIQAVIRAELAQARSRGVRHILLFPIRESAAEDPQQVKIGVRLDGSFVGVLPPMQVKSDLLDPLVRTNVELVGRVHGLLGWDTEAIALLAESTDRFEMWIHDLSGTCANYRLSWNELDYCNAPQPNSLTCHLCAFGSSRTLVRENIDKILSVLNPSLVFPSTEAQRMWTRTYDYSGDSIVRPPVTLVDPRSKHVASIARRLRVAYLGLESRQKGFDVFANLAAWNMSAEALDLYWFGSETRKIPGVESVPFDSRHAKATSGSSIATELLAERDIDAVLIVPSGFETFSLVGYEAMAAGAIVITLASTGHLASAVKKYQDGLSFPDQLAVSRALRDRRVHFDLQRRSGRSKRYRLQWNSLAA